MPDGQPTRRRWLYLNLAVPLMPNIAGERLDVRRESDVLRVSAPRLQFLSGKPLERLRDGVSVASPKIIQTPRSKPSRRK